MMVDVPAPDSTPIVYVIDDDGSVRAALEDLLASVGLAAMLFGSTRAFLDATRPDAPGCLVLDVRMPGQSGMEFHRQIAALGIMLPVIFITGHGDIAMSVRAMKAGAVEFLAKPFANQDLLDAIHRGIELDRKRRSDDRQIQGLERRFNDLTDGERAVMALVVKGLLNKQIAGELGVSEITVKVRRRQAMLKMGAGSLPDLVRISDALLAVRGRGS
jgi:FixJ family two-component response regulator